MKQLGIRLQTVADKVRDGRRVADIGTDHALLPVYLVQQGRCPSAIASDIGEGPADAARHTVEAAGLSHKIAVRVGDGLTTVHPDETDDIVIAGMGGETVVSILQNAPWVADSRYHLLLQPMSRPEQLRHYLYQNGFSIIAEPVVAEHGHIYSVMEVAFTGERRNPTAADDYIGAIQPTESGVLYVQKQLERQKKQVNGLKSAAADPQSVRACEAVCAALEQWLANL